MPLSRRLHPLWGLLLALCFFCATHTAWAGFFDPKLQWQTLSTEHFNIHFYKGEEEAAYRMTLIAEKIYGELSPRFQWKPWGRTEIVLTNSTDISNGLTTTLPYNYIVLLIAPPQGDSALNYYDNWLEDLFRHEFAHTLHLDMYGGSAIPLRWVLQRTVTPNALTPGWVREGIATQQESLTGRGRVNNSFSEMMLRTDILENRFLALDQMAGIQYEWPGFNAAYIYGGKFWDYLTDTYGADKVYEFSRRYAASVWLFSLNNKARKTFNNKNFFKLHREWKEKLTQKYQNLKSQLEAEGLTPLQTVKSTDGLLQHPTLSRDGIWLLYTQEDNLHDSEIRMRKTDGSEDRMISREKSGNQFSFHPDGKKVVYSDTARYKKFYQYYDLYELDLNSGTSERLTQGERAFHPDYSPDGKKIVFVKNELLSTRLYLWDVEKKTSSPLTPAEPALQFSNPRFSPDGKTIAVSLWKKGRRDIYLYNLQGQVLNQVTHDEAIDLNPSFSPEGHFLYFTSDVTGITNLYRYHLASGSLERLSNVLTGIFEPQVGKDFLYVKHYTGKGYDLRRFPIPESQNTNIALSALLASQAGEAAEGALKNQSEKNSAVFTDLDPTWAAPEKLEAKKYNPFLKLFIPRFIAPSVFFTDNAFLLSGNIGSADPLLRHIWRGAATYRTDANFLGGSFLYTYNRYWPSLFVGFNDFVVNYGDLFRIGQNFFEERSIGTVGVSLAAPVYGSHRLSAYYFFEHRSSHSDIPPDAVDIPSLGNFSGFGVRYEFSRAKKHPADISLEGGPRLLVDFQATDSALGTSPNNEQIIFSGDLREYIELPMPAHVLAFRLAGGIAFGDKLLQGTFRLGSATGESLISGPTPRLYTLRGLPEISFAGERALLMSGEYRLPLVDPQRGAGTMPLHLQRLHMAFFADYGSVFDGNINFDNFLLGVGAELRGDFVLFYGLPLTGRVGYGIIVVGRRFLTGLTDPILGGSVDKGTLILELGTSF